MKKYKYKIGQRVEFKKTKYREIYCKCCGSLIDTKEEEIKMTGEIIGRRYDTTILIQSPVFEDRTRTLPNGDVLHAPIAVKLGPGMRREPYYRIKARNGKIEDVVEEKIVGVK